MSGGKRKKRKELAKREGKKGSGREPLAAANNSGSLDKSLGITQFMLNNVEPTFNYSRYGSFEERSARQDKEIAERLLKQKRAEKLKSTEKNVKNLHELQRKIGSSQTAAHSAIVDYWSGAQAQIFFGDTFVDEVFAFQYDVVTNRSPVYGYASKEFDAVAEGNRLISGTFAINFIHQHYLPITLKELENDKRGIELKSTMKQNAYRDLFKKLDAFKKQQAANQLKNLGNVEFRQLAAALKKDKDKAKGRERLKGGAGAIYNGTQMVDYIDPFYDTGYFDIYVTFSDPADSFDGTPTLKKISKATIISSGMTINSSGQPILETYSFLAQSID